MPNPEPMPLQILLKQEVSRSLEKYMKLRRFSQVDLAAKTGIPKTTLNGYVKGTSLPTPGNTEKLAQALNVSKADIDPRFKEITLPDNVVLQTGKKLVRIPILGTIACGDAIYAEENFKGWREEAVDSLPSGTIIYLDAQGDSMEPTIPDKACVMVRMQPDVENGEIAAVLVNSDTEATLKRVKKQDGMIILMPDNPHHQPYIVTESNPVTIIGKAVRFMQNL